jgi:hypothetical protein
LRSCVAQRSPGGRERPVEAVRDQPLGPLAPAAGGQRGERAPQRLAPGGEQARQLCIGYAELLRGAGARRGAQVHERERALGLGGEVGQRRLHLRERVHRVGRTGQARGKRSQRGTLHGERA